MGKLNRILRAKFVNLDMEYAKQRELNDYARSRAMELTRRRGNTAWASTVFHTYFSDGTHMRMGREVPTQRTKDWIRKQLAWNREFRLSHPLARIPSP